MPLRWVLSRELKPRVYETDTHWTALSGELVVSSVKREVWAQNMPAFVWAFGLDAGPRSSGHCDAIEEGKVRVEAAWEDWLRRAGLTYGEPDSQ